MSDSMRTRFVGHGVAAPGANTDIIGSDITPDRNGAFRVTVVLATASVLNVMIDDGTNSYACGLNESNALQAGDLYTFTFSVAKQNGYNFQVETNGIIQVLQVDEVSGGEL